MINLASNAHFADAKGRLAGELETALRQQQDPRILGKGDIFDTYENVGPRTHSWDRVMNAKAPTTR
jgi:hypothetical protein